MSDRIKLVIDAPDEVIAAARTHEALIRSETLATEISYAEAANGISSKIGDGIPVRIALLTADRP